jgi:hypothetical protein
MMQRIFDLPRWLLAGFSLSLLIFLMMYSLIQGFEYQRKLTAHLQNPTVQPQYEISLGFLKIDRVEDIKITGHDSQHHYRLIRERSMPIQAGEVYSFIGTIKKSGSIKIKRMQHHPYRLYKYLISGSAIIVVLFLIIKNVRIQKKGKYLRLINWSNLS